MRLFVGTHRQPGPALEAVFRIRLGVLSDVPHSARGIGTRTWQVLRFSPTQRSVRVSSMCIWSNTGKVAFAGNFDSTADPNSVLAVGGKPASGDIAYQLVRSGHETLFRLFPTIFHRASLFRPSWVGAWAYYVAAIVLVLVLLAAVGTLLATSSGPQRDADRRDRGRLDRIPQCRRSGRSSCQPFNPPDEAAHYAYVESLGEHHRLPYKDPSLPGGSYSAEALLAIQYTAIHVIQHREVKPPWTSFEETEWAAQNSTIRQRRPDLVGGGFTAAGSYSPLYYALEVPAYVAGKGSDVFTRLELMRLMSALIAAATALCGLSICARALSGENMGGCAGRFRRSAPADVRADGRSCEQRRAPLPPGYAGTLCLGADSSARDVGLSVLRLPVLCSASESWRNRPCSRSCPSSSQFWHTSWFETGGGLRAIAFRRLARHRLR